MSLTYLVSMLVTVAGISSMYIGDTDISFNNGDYGRDDDCNNQKYELQRKYDDCMKTANSCKDTVKQLKSQIESLICDKESLQGRLDVCNKKCDNQDRKDWKAQVEYLTKQNNDYQKQINELYIYIKKLQKDGSDGDNDCKKKLDKYKVDNGDLTRQITTINIQITQIKIENEKLKSDVLVIKNLRLTIKKLQDSLADATNDYQKCYTNYTNITIELKNCKEGSSDSEKCKGRINELTIKLDECTKNLGNCSYKLDNCDKKLKDCNKQVTELLCLQTDLDDYKKKYNDMCEKNDKCESLNVSINLTINQLKQQIVVIQNNCDAKDSELNATKIKLIAEIERLKIIIEQLKKNEGNNNDKHNWNNCKSDLAYWKRLFGQCKDDLVKVSKSLKKKKNSNYDYDNNVIMIGDSLDSDY